MKRLHERMEIAVRENLGTITMHDKELIHLVLGDVMTKFAEHVPKLYTSAFKDKSILDLANHVKKTIDDFNRAENIVDENHREALLGREPHKRPPMPEHGTFEMPEKMPEEAPQEEPMPEGGQEMPPQEQPMPEEGLNPIDELLYSAADDLAANNADGLKKKDALDRMVDKMIDLKIQKDIESTYTPEYKGISLSACALMLEENIDQVIAAERGNHFLDTGEDISGERDFIKSNDIALWKMNREMLASDGAVGTSTIFVNPDEGIQCTIIHMGPEGCIQGRGG